LPLRIRIPAGCGYPAVSRDAFVGRLPDRWDHYDRSAAGYHSWPRFPPTSGFEWWDPDAECTLVVSSPSADPDLWKDYLAGAVRSYRKHRVERALDLAAFRDGADTAMFWAAVDADGRVIGGVRAKGPLTCADESHAVVEWAGQPGLPAVRKVITDRLPFGVVEVKTAWVTTDPERNQSLTRVLARAPLHAMVPLNAQFAMATSASHVLDRWASSGGVVASRIPATPYPDERYRTKIMFWDRRTFANHAEPSQASRVFAELTSLAQHLNKAASTDALPGGFA
jgi:hypothetical protein